MNREERRAFARVTLALYMAVNDQFEAHRDVIERSMQDDPEEEGGRVATSREARYSLRADGLHREPWGGRRQERVSPDVPLIPPQAGEWLRTSVNAPAEGKRWSGTGWHLFDGSLSFHPQTGAMGAEARCGKHLILSHGRSVEHAPDPAEGLRCRKCVLTSEGASR